MSAEWFVLMPLGIIALALLGILMKRSFLDREWPTPRVAYPTSLLPKPEHDSALAWPSSKWRTRLMLGSYDWMLGSYDWRAWGHRLMVTRLALGISEQEAADAYGVTLRTYRGYEAGKRSRGGGWMDFAEKYDVSIDWLCSGDPGYLRPHLTKGTRGKIAILPAMSSRQRRNWLRNEAGGPGFPPRNGAA